MNLKDGIKKMISDVGDYKKHKPDPTSFIRVRQGDFTDDEIRQGLKDEMGYSKRQAKKAVKDYKKDYGNK